MNFIEENNSTRKKINDILKRITNDEWQTEIGGGWTAGTMLCHIAFWDKMTINRLLAWKQGGNLATVPEKETIDAVNDSVRSMCSFIAFEKGVFLVSKYMEEIDTFVSQLEASQIKELEDSGRGRWFQRNLHRQLHLELLERSTAR
ncbi:MAG: hypothetical protein OEV66_07640 [Spirochaetia bacterium]|nr:hypothetical protein [Spirochaetia bacterium]